MLSNSINWLIECKKARTSRQPQSRTWQPSWPGGFEQMCLSVELWQDSEEGGDKDQTDVWINNVGGKTYCKPLKWKAMNSYHVDVCRPFSTYSSPLHYFDKGGGHNASPSTIPACVHTCHIDSYHGNFYWVMLQKGVHVMVGMQLRVELKRLRHWCLCFFYIFWSIQDITQGNQEWSDPHIPIILIVYSSSELPHLYIFCSGM